MKFSYKWLTEYVDIPVNAVELAEKLTLSGFEVEAVEPQGQGLLNIITVRIDSIKKHPDADKLVVSQCFDGQDYHQIVTAAPNIYKGAIVPLSLPGAVLMGNLKIKKGTLRGIESNGMLCSEKELGVAEEANGIWILPEDTPIGIDFISYGMLCDTVMDISILPNRGDCLSLIGMAREIAAIFKTKLKLPKADITTELEKNPVQIINQNTSLCPKYTAQLLKDITIKPSPMYMQRCLQLSGIRPINNIVDITNYVLLECGQPLHAFDYHLLESQKIVIKCAEEKQKFQTLDDEEHTLTSESLLICDEHKAIALGGIMGGKNTEIKDTTKDVLLESAYFNPSNIRKTQLKLGIRTESSIRFEKGVDYDFVEFSSNRAAHLMQQLAGAKILSSIACNKITTPSTSSIHFDANQINTLLGTEFEKHEMLDILSRIGMNYDEKNSTLQIPSWRLNDLKEFPDIAEEIARIKGYNNIPSSLPVNQINIKKPSQLQQLCKQIPSMLISKGILEIDTFPMISQIDIDKLESNIKTARIITK